MWCSRSASALEAFEGNSLGRREAVEQGEAVQTFLEAPGKVVLPALRGQPTALADLLHGHAENQHVMHEGGPIGAEFMFDTVEPRHRLFVALP